MRFLILTINLTLFLLLSAAAIAAQQSTVALSSGGFVSVGGHLPGTPLSTQTPQGSPLTANLNFGNVAAGNYSRRVRITMPIRVSATTNYKIELQRTSSGDNSFAPQNIGFGALNARAQTGGNPKLTANATNLNIFGSFNSNPGEANVIGGVPQFTATLADIGESPTVVLTGVPTVASGDLGENDNSILIDLTFVVMPQYFAATDFSTLNVLFTISPLP